MPHIVREIQYVTVEVPRIEREIEFATVEVTRVVRDGRRDADAPGQWFLDVTPGISLGTPRTGAQRHTPVDGRILLAGGGDGSDDMYTLVEIFDPVSGALPRCSAQYAAQRAYGYAAGDNRVLVVGGYNAQQGWLADAELYDPLLNTWTVVPPLYPHGVQHSATLLADGRVLVTGGCIASGVCSDRAEAV